MPILPHKSAAGLASGAEITHQAQAEQKSGISRSMHAKLKLNAHLMAESRDELAVELARDPNLNPQEMLDRITEIQNVAKKVEELSKSYPKPSESKLTPADLDVMRDMAKKYGQKVTADCFSTKQPAVSDLLNGKSKV
jgi:hypothetical protein